MLRSLYDYAVRNGLTVPPGFVKKTVKAYISLSTKFDDPAVVPGTDEAELAPDIGPLANSAQKCNVLVEKRSVVLPETDSAKSRFFLQVLRDAAEADPRLTRCVELLENPFQCEMIRRELDALKVKPGDRISFQIDGRSISSSPEIVSWWKMYRTQFLKGAESPSARCIITGEPTVPALTTPPIQGLISVGGHGRGDALICFDKAAFCSYGLKKAENAPVSEEAFAAVKSALDALIAQAPRPIAGMIFVHWFERELPPEQDPILQTVDFWGSQQEEAEEADDEETLEYERRQAERAALQTADRLVGSVAGKEESIELDGTAYHILLLSGVTGRIMIRGYERGTYGELKRSLDQWRSDLRLTNSTGTGSLPNCKLTHRLFQLLKRQGREPDVRKQYERLNKELSGVTPAILRSILTGAPLPDSVAVRALQYIRSCMLDAGEDRTSGSALFEIARNCQWLKVWLIRSRKKGDALMSEYNPELESAPYQCGAMMAVYSAIQIAANPTVNTTVVQRYYASAIQTPALVMGRLSQMSIHHLEKLENRWLASEFQRRLWEIGTRIPDRIPTTLNLEEQAEFTLGYYQMSALLEKEKRARIAEKQKTKQDTENTKEE